MLIVDDDPRFTAVVSQPLDRAGYRIVSAVNGATALALTSLGVLSMAIVDLYLSNENGLELIAQLRHLQPDLPCLLWSGMLSASVQREAHRRGVLCFDKASDSIPSMLEELRNGGGPVHADDVSKEEVLRRYYVARVGMHGGVSQAARALGVSRSTIQRHLRPSDEDQ